MANPTLEEQLIDTLKSAIAAKDDLINHLKKEIQRLQSSQTPTNPFSDPNTLMIQPQPAYPPGFQGIPCAPILPWTVTAGDIVLCTSHDMVKWGDQKSGGESCKKCGFGSGWLSSGISYTKTTCNTNGALSTTITNTDCLEGGFDGLLK